jgi:chemosensory pili system protein ChpA (sensor histidine kinase/response regulator)
MSYTGGILLDRRKTSRTKTIAQDAAQERGAAERHADTTIKVFLDDVGGRIKTLLKRKKSETVKTFIAFLEKLSREERPVETIEALGISAVSDFAGFMRSMKTKLADTPEQSSAAYQLLTENLEATAQFLASLAAELKGQRESQRQMAEYVQSSKNVLVEKAKVKQAEADSLAELFTEEVPATSLTKETTTPDTVTAPPVHERPDETPDPKKRKTKQERLSDDTSLSPPRPVRRAANGTRAYFVGKTPPKDWGITLNALLGLVNGTSSNGHDVAERDLSVPTAKALPSEKSGKDVVLPQKQGDRTSPALRKFVGAIAAFAERYATKEPVPKESLEALVKISKASDCIAAVRQFEFISGVSDFVEFLGTINEENISAIGNETIEDIGKHLIALLSEATKRPADKERIEDYLELPDEAELSSEVSHILETLRTTPLPDETPLEDADAFQTLKGGLENDPESSIPSSDALSELSGSAPTEQEYIEFANDILKTVKSLLKPSETAALGFMNALMAMPDALTAMATSEMPFLRDLADFVGQSWINKMPISRLAAYKKDIVQGLMQSLQTRFNSPASGSAPLDDAPLFTDEEAETSLSAFKDERAVQDEDGIPILSELSDLFSDEEKAEWSPEPPTKTDTLFSDDDALSGLNLDNFNLDEPAKQAKPPALADAKTDTKTDAKTEIPVEPLPDILAGLDMDSFGTAEGLDDEPKRKDSIPEEPKSEDSGVEVPIESAHDGLALPSLDSLLTDEPAEPAVSETKTDYNALAKAFVLKLMQMLPATAAGDAALAELRTQILRGDLLMSLKSSAIPKLTELGAGLINARETNKSASATETYLAEKTGETIAALLEYFAIADEETDEAFSFSDFLETDTAIPDTSEVRLPEGQPDDTLTAKLAEPQTLITTPTGKTDAPTSDLLIDDLFADGLLSDDADASLAAEPATSYQDLKAPKADDDLFLHDEELLMPDDLTALTTEPTPVELTPVEPTPVESALDSPSLDSFGDFLIDDEPKAESPKAELPKIETSKIETPKIETPEVPPQKSELAIDEDFLFDDSLLLDESLSSDLLDTPSSKESLTDLRNLSAKAQKPDTEFDMTGGDGLLDENMLDDTEFLMMSDLKPPTASQPAPDSLSSENLLGENAFDEEPQNKSPETQFALEPLDTLPDLDFSGLDAGLDTGLSNQPAAELASEARATETKKNATPENPSRENLFTPIFEKGNNFQPDEIQQIFLEEAREYLEKLSEDMMELDKLAGTVQTDLVNKVMRGAHTLKGSAAMVQLSHIAELSHKMEDALQTVRDNNLKVPRPLLDVLFQSHDAVSAMIENFRATGRDYAGDTSALVSLLKTYNDQLQAKGELSTEEPSSVAPSDDDEGITADFQPDEIQQIFIEEAKEYLEKLSEDMMELDKLAGTVQTDLVHKVMRGAHTLKGSAAMVQLSNIAELSHKMEDALQTVRDNNLKVPRVLLDVLFQSHDAVSAMLKKFQRTGKDTKDVATLVAALKEYNTQLVATGEITTTIALSQQKVQPAESQTGVGQAQKKTTVAEETVRIDIKSLNSLVNMSAELVISRNRLNNELGAISRMINKFMKERNQLGQVNKKITAAIQKQTGDKGTVGEGGFSDVLKEFSDSEFDRFSDLDIISRDVRSSMINLDEAINDLRGLSSLLGQNVVKVSGIANDLNREIVGMRMVPVRQMFSRFSRSVRDVAQKEGKEINFITEGEETKLDKSVMEEIVEPLMHMVRNAVGHGIEKPDVRQSVGKSPIGTLTLRAYQKGSRVILEVQDDGSGLHVDKIKLKAIKQGLISETDADTMTPAKASELIFRPGFSTADKITELSGRGVGMDVVQNTIRQLKGTVNVETFEGRGTKFTISLPLTLAINNALLVSANEFTYAMPLELVSETLFYEAEKIESYDDGKQYIKLREELIEFKYLNALLGYSTDQISLRTKLPVAVISLDHQKFAIAVDKLIGKDEIVVKTLGKHLKNVKGITGATILGDGQVVIILDIEYLLRPAEQRDTTVYIAAETKPIDAPLEPAAPETKKRKRKNAKITVLHADDSPSVRKYVQSILKGANIDVISADDGLNALTKLPTSNVDLVVSDLEMPRMNGFELVSEIRKMPEYQELPVIIVTARAGDKHRRTGLELGANAFLNKPFDPQQLIETIENYVA